MRKESVPGNRHLPLSALLQATVFDLAEQAISTPSVDFVGMQRSRFAARGTGYLEFSEPSAIADLARHRYRAHWSRRIAT